MQVCALRLFRYPERSIPHRHDPRPTRSTLTRPLQAVDLDMFNTELEQWLDSLPSPASPLQGHCPLQARCFVAPATAIVASAYTRSSLPQGLSLPLSIWCASVPLPLRPPAVPSIWYPISDWGNVVTWNIVEVLQHAARSLLRPYDATETLAGQLFVQIFLSLTTNNAHLTRTDGFLNALLDLIVNMRLEMSLPRGIPA